MVYDAGSERYGNYVPTVLPRRYDAFLYLDETRTLRPLHAPWSGEPDEPETFPLASRGRDAVHSQFEALGR